MAQNNPSNSTPAISVIVSTYNSEAWLEKVLWGYEAQTFRNFEVVIADDGSKQPTFDLLEKMKAEVTYPIKHIWQEDEGFQKSRILNKAIIACDAEYIVMSDGDCIPRKDFLEVHNHKKEQGFFLSGGYFMLPMSISKLISKEDILSQRCFEVKWLKSNGLKTSFKNNKLKAKGVLEGLLNFFTPTKATWNGHNASGWKSDILAVNGFDERMQYGGEDREIGERLINSGKKPKQIRYSAICLHLDHKRGYVTPDMIEKNNKIRAITKKEKAIKTLYGIEK